MYDRCAATISTRWPLWYVQVASRESKRTITAGLGDKNTQLVSPSLLMQGALYQERLARAVFEQILSRR